MSDSSIKSEEAVLEPKEMSLEEQADIEPSREMSSQTEDFETKVSVAGPHNPRVR